MTLEKKSQQPHVVNFVHQQIRRAKDMLLEGAALGGRLHGRFGMEIRAIIRGGLSICDALTAQGDDIYSRPRLSTLDKIKIILGSIAFR